MNKQRKIGLISLIMTIALIVLLGCMNSASANSTVMPQYTYTYYDGSVWTYYLDGDGNATIVNTTKTSGSVSIPLLIDEHAVTAINDSTSTQSIFGTTADGAPNTTVTSVDIPLSVTAIGDGAFMNCTALNSVPFSIRDVKSLGHAVFYKDTALTSITLPISINSIGSNTFIDTGIDSMANITYGEFFTSRFGYTFKGWYKTADGSGDQLTTLILATDNAYAIWTPNTYTVTLDPQNGTVTPETQNYVYGTAYAALPTPVYPGHTFAGWNTAANGSGTAINTASIVSIPNNHTLYAQWDDATYTVTFDLQGGSLTSGGPTKDVTFGAAYGVLPEAEKPNYVLGSWRTAANGGGTEVISTTQVTITADQTLYAKWIAIPSPVPSPSPSAPADAYIPPKLTIIRDTDRNARIDVSAEMIPSTVDDTEVFATYTGKDSVKHIIPGNYSSATRKYTFLYDSLPENADVTIAMEYTRAEPSSINEEHWAYNDASRLLLKGVLKSKNTLPNMNMTREGLVTMLYNSVAHYLEPPNTTKPMFSDIACDDTAVIWAAESGISKGFPDGTFKPAAEISRQEAFVIIARFLKTYRLDFADTGTADTHQKFPDMDDVNAWALDDIETFIKYGLIQGIPDGDNMTIMPTMNVTNGEIIALIERMIETCF